MNEQHHQLFIFGRKGSSYRNTYQGVAPRTVHLYSIVEVAVQQQHYKYKYFRSSTVAGAALSRSWTDNSRFFTTLRWIDFVINTTTATVSSNVSFQCLQSLLVV